MMTSIIIILVLLGVIVWQIYPAISAPHSSEFTTQDGLEDVVKKETTIDIVGKNNIKLKNNIVKDIIEKCPTHETEGVRQLSEHIKDVIQKNPEKVKRLNKRERKTVDKIVKEKK